MRKSWLADASLASSRLRSRKVSRSYETIAILTRAIVVSPCIIQLGVTRVVIALSIILFFVSRSRLKRSVRSDREMLRNEIGPRDRAESRERRDGRENWIIDYTCEAASVDDGFPDQPWISNLLLRVMRVGRKNRPGSRMQARYRSHAVKVHSYHDCIDIDMCISHAEHICLIISNLNTI